MKSNLAIKTFFFFVVVVLMSSCKKFLEKPVSSDVTLNDVFSSKDKTEQALWNVYSTALIYEFPYFYSGSDYSHYHYGNHWGLLAIATDEASQGIGNYTGGAYMNVGNWGPSGGNSIKYLEFDSWYCYRGIRNANIFIENVDKSPFSDNEKAAMKAEAIFLRALMHFDLMQRLGGVSIVDKTLKVSSAEDIQGIKVPRSTLKETVDFIVSQCDESAKNLPSTYESKYRGRITKGAALALKSRTLLYAASPLWNSNEPYVPVSDPKLREMVGYPSYDASRWQLAADAAKAVLDWAANESGGCVLYKGIADYADNYEQIFLSPYVPEIILDAGYGGLTTDNYFIRFMTPGKLVYGGVDPVNHAMTFNYAKFYQKKDGTEQVWDEKEGVQYPYNTYKTKLKELDPRFQATVFYSGEEWVKGSGTRYDFYASQDKLLDQYNGVGFLRKFVKGAATSKPAPRWITFRLAEFYLNYAEALNEANGDPNAITGAVNEIRRRAGMPDITYTNQADMRERIRRERNVELAFEEHRFFDVRRWKIAGNEGVMKGGMWELKLNAGGGSPYYTLQKFQSRVWDDKMYLYPFKQEEVDKGYIVQNPGW